MKSAKLQLVDYNSGHSSQVEPEPKQAPLLRLVASELSDSGTSADKITPELDLPATIFRCVRELDQLQDTMRRLSLESRVEAKRIGSAGIAFQMIASEIDAASRRITQTSTLIDSLNEQAQPGEIQLTLVSSENPVNPRRA